MIDSKITLLANMIIYDLTEVEQSIVNALRFAGGVMAQSDLMRIVDCHFLTLESLQNKGIIEIEKYKSLEDLMKRFNQIYDTVDNESNPIRIPIRVKTAHYLILALAHLLSTTKDTDERELASAVMSNLLTALAYFVPQTRPLWVEWADKMCIILAVIDNNHENN